MIIATTTTRRTAGQEEDTKGKGFSEVFMVGCWYN
jgi:hypothetical protein